MPLLAGSSLPPPPDTTPDPGVPNVTGTLLYIEDVGTMSAQWTAPDGTVWPLTDVSEETGWFTPDAIEGWDARPYEYTLDPLPRGGDDIRFIRAQSGHVAWPLYIWGNTHQQFVDRYRSIRQAFMMTAWRHQPGVLRVTRPDGSAREIEAYYQEGFAGKAGEGWLYAKPVLNLLCPDGYWRDTDQLSISRTYGLGSSFFSPFPTISSSQVLGSTILNNPGDVIAWPNWTITGPATGIVATNNTTGQTFTLSYNLLAGEQATITTLKPTVRGPAGQNISSALNFPTAYLWGLLAGNNDTSFVLAGAGEGTNVTLSFYPRYEGA